MITKTYKLYNGVEIPAIALGTWQVPSDIAIKTVTDALNIGYTHIDTACDYRNEVGVGEAIRNHNVKRENIFVTSKILAEIKSYEGAKCAINQSLVGLNIDYIDLMLIHAPKPWAEMHEGSTKDYFKENIEVWKALEEAYTEGKVKAIGVSNFGVKDLENILNNCTIKPMVNQIRAFIGEMPEETIAFSKENNLIVEAYSPIGSGQLLNDEKITNVAKKYNVSLPQLCIKYLLQRELLPLPKSTHKKYIKENFHLDFEISQEDMTMLNNFNK